VIVELITRKILDQIVLIPAGDPQLREQAPKADGQSRLEMCKLAVSDLPAGIKENVLVSDIEIKRTGPSYSIDTVENFAKNNAELFWIIGSDAYAKIDKWHRANELKEKVSFIVVDRPGDNGIGLDIGALDISATEIRSELKFNNTSPSVRTYIAERNLYAS
jgi:nicotinate-nucleotide adenylyltransferase